MGEQKDFPPLPITLSPQGIRGYLETKALIKSYVSVLETTAAEYEKDKAKSAHAVIAATVTFLIALH